MKNFKKISAMILAVLMLLSISTFATAFAKPNTDMIDNGSVDLGNDFTDCCVGSDIADENVSCCAVSEEMEASATMHCTQGCGRFVGLINNIYICVRYTCYVDWCDCWEMWG